MGRGIWARRRRHLGPLFLMLCGALAIAVVVIGVMSISKAPNVAAGYPTIAEQKRAPLRR